MNYWIRRIRLKAVSAATMLAVLFAPPLVVGQGSDLEIGEGEMLESLKFSAMPLVQVLDMLEGLTGRSVIRPQQLPTPEFTFNSRGPISREDAIIAVESLLSINGIGISPLGEKFLKVTPINTIGTEAPELVIASLRDRQPSGKVVSKLFRLQYLDSQTFQNQIGPFLTPGTNSVIPFQNSNAVIVTDTISNLQRLEYVVSEVDKPSKLNIETKFFTLNYAQATEVAEQMQRLIEDARSRFGSPDGQAPSNSTNRNRANRQQPGGAVAGAVAAALPASTGAEGAIPVQILFGSNTAIAADERTNQLIIMTEPANLQFFEEIIEKLDVKADPATRIDVIQLSHADATEVASLLSQVIDGRNNQESADRTQTVNTSPNGRNLTFGNRNNQQAANQNQRQTQVNNAVQSVSEEKESQFSDFMTVIADERSNALIVSGTRTDLELIREVVGRIDVLLPQVQIEVLIVDINLTKGVSRGSEVLAGIYDQATQGYTASTTNIFGVDFSDTTFNIQNGEVADLMLNAVFRRARDDSNVKVMSVPSVITSHNREATITVGRAEPIISGTQSDLGVGGGTALRSSFSFEDITTELTVTPLIGPNDVIQLEINQKADEVADRIQIDGNSQPIIGRRELTSFISAKNGELYILGGLQRRSNSLSTGKPSMIGEIPLIGRLFSSRTKDNDRSELVLFIRPTILRKDSENIELAREKLDGSEGRRAVESFLETGEIDLREKTKSKGRSKSKGSKARR